MNWRVERNFVNKSRKFNSDQEVGVGKRRLRNPLKSRSRNSSIKLATRDVISREWQSVDKVLWSFGGRKCLAPRCRKRSETGFCTQR